MFWGDPENKPQASILDQAAKTALEATKNPMDSPAGNERALEVFIEARFQREKQMQDTSQLSERELNAAREDVLFLDDVIPKVVTRLTGTSNYYRAKNMQDQLKERIEALKEPEEKVWKSIIKQFD